ncbi:MAG TPA: family 2A encapsulin nanocompartment cargo protein cysteine desulfurase [Cellvibrionaceae bacterium]
MTIQIPTKLNSPVDIADLATLANAFFRALPGDTIDSALPIHAQTVASSPVQSLLPAQSPTQSIAPQSIPPQPSNAVEPFGFYGGVSPQAFGLPTEAQLRDLLIDEPHYGRGLIGQAPSTAPPLNLSSLPASSQDPFVQPGLKPQQATGAYYFLSETGPWSNALLKTDESGQHSNSTLDVNAIRRDFPILTERVNGKPLVWFDNAATTQKPQVVMDRLNYFYRHENSNIHRAAHELAARATDAYENARQTVADFLGAASSEEIIFLRGATEAINLLANTFGEQCVQAGDDIIVSQLEHHANIVPWHNLATRKGAHLKVIPVDDSGQLQLSALRNLIGPRTKLIAVTQVSNALGTVTPINEIIQIAHQAGVPVMVDGAQAVSHMQVNVQALDADFYVFSGHKVFGPTGIGVLYGKSRWLQQIPHWQGGGNMIADVTFEKITYQQAPNKFEAGTGNIADAVGLAAAIDYVNSIGLNAIHAYEHELLTYATAGLRNIPGLRLIGTATQKASVASFVLAGYANEQVGKQLNEEGIAVRSGHHCAQPILRRMGVETCVRPSLAFYNTFDEIDRMLSVLSRLAGKNRLY